MKTPKELVESRTAEYGETWAVHGQILKPIVPLVSDLSNRYPPILFPWHMILNKLIRILYSPMNKDHWADIQGYAQLIIDMLETLDEQGEELDSK